MAQTESGEQVREPPASEPKRRRSHAGRIAGAALALASVGSVGTGLVNASHHASGPTCGGTERWDVKVGNDEDADSVSDTPITGKTISYLNSQVLPGPTDQGGRMEVEKKQYTITGYLAFFKHETDSDYHLVITDEVGGYSTGHSIIVEIPDPNCFAGHDDSGSSSSHFDQQITAALQEFKANTSGVTGTAIPVKSIPVTITGVAFFDFMHKQTGHSLIHTGVDGGQKVLELHPVTAIEFSDSD